LLSAARRRARDLYAPFTLSASEVFDRLERQGGRGAVAGIACLAPPTGTRPGAFEPVVQTVAEGRAYRCEDVWIVCRVASGAIRERGVAALRAVAARS
jgi:hypothetical protein